MAKKSKAEKMEAVSAPEHDKWQAEDDYRTLSRAEEIKADEKRLGAAHKHAKTVAKSHKKVIRSIDDLKAARNEAHMPKDDDDGDDV